MFFGNDILGSAGEDRIGSKSAAPRPQPHPWKAPKKSRLIVQSPNLPPNPTLNYQSPSPKPKSMVWVYGGRVILFVFILLVAAVLFAVLWFITFYVSLGSGPMEAH
jgi:hypothetical protein